MRCPLGVAVGWLALAVSAGRADVVERRGAEPALEGTITDITDAGVTVRSGLGALHLVPWDRVRRVPTEGLDPSLRVRLESYRVMAGDLWRARSRVERHDTELAEPLLERLFEQYEGKTNETALVVAEGLLRCRIARADHVLAVVPALEVARLRRAGVSTETYTTLAPAYDDTYAVCTVLPPVWVESPLLESLAHELATYDARDDEVVNTLAQLYRRAVLRALGRPSDGVAAALEHPGVRLLERISDCAADDPDRRNAAREQLRRAIPDLPPWAEAWARYAIGVSLLAESGVARHQQGAVSLIHLPARYGRSQPFLAGLALAEAARTLQGDGDLEAAATLRLELQRSYPNHPLHRGRLEQRFEQAP